MDHKRATRAGTQRVHEVISAGCLNLDNLEARQGPEWKKIERYWQQIRVGLAPSHSRSVTSYLTYGTAGTTVGIKSRAIQLGLTRSTLRWGEKALRVCDLRHYAAGDCETHASPAGYDIFMGSHHMQKGSPGRKEDVGQKPKGGLAEDRRNFPTLVPILVTYPHCAEVSLGAAMERKAPSPPPPR